MEIAKGIAIFFGGLGLLAAAAVVLFATFRLMGRIITALWEIVSPGERRKRAERRKADAEWEAVKADDPDHAKQVEKYITGLP